nr:MAG TPA: hypothetical protein [Caudoviricetes sp.]
MLVVAFPRKFPVERCRQKRVSYAFIHAVGVIFNRISSVKL